MRKHALVLLLSLFLATTAFAQWTEVSDGVSYQRIQRGPLDAHVVRVEVRNPKLRMLASREEDRGLTVTEFAKKNDAIVAINGDYFDKAMHTIGLAMGPCGVWDRPQEDVRRQAIVAVGRRRAAIFAPRTEPTRKPARWMNGAVSGWPMLISGCHAYTAKELPGSDHFTRAPHPRTAVGLSRDGKLMYLVVTDGRREGVPGLTLAELGAFMQEEFGICTAVNLDGGGSTAMWVGDRIVNRPSDPEERKVANHLAIVAPKDFPKCSRN